MFGLKKLFGNIQRLGSKRNFANLARIGKKISHETTRQLGGIAKIAGNVSSATGSVPPIQMFADAVGSAARAGQTGIEIGKDLGARDLRSAKGRTGQLSRELAQTGASLAGAGLFIA